MPERNGGTPQYSRGDQQPARHSIRALLFIGRAGAEGSIMDGLCDFCDEIRFIDLYRSLCRHIYYQYPQLVGEHVALFRALFEGPDEK